MTFTSYPVAVSGLEFSGDSVPKPLGFIALGQKHGIESRRRHFAAGVASCPWSVVALELLPSIALSSTTASRA